MLALLAYEGTLCPGCGGPLGETTAPESEEAYKVAAARCHRCTAIAKEAHGFRENEHPHALMYRAMRR